MNGIELTQPMRVVCQNTGAAPSAHFNQASAYVLKIRNPRKQQYAAGWLGFRAGILAHKPTEKGLSYMAAQAVRIHIDNILNPDQA